MVVIAEHVAQLKQQASERYSISPETCHLGHVILEGLLQYPDSIHQVNQLNIHFYFNLYETPTYYKYVTTVLAEQLALWALDEEESSLIRGWTNLGNELW